MKLKIGIAGARGIPNEYGGFEQFATYLSELLSQKGHDITVYSPHNHSYKSDCWNGVHIVHCYNPEDILGTAGQFVYDMNCLRDARKRSYDILLLLGYTSSSVWGRWYPKQTVIITNMDGLEWKRSKYKHFVQRFLLYAERMAIRYTDYVVADSPAIKTYLDRKYSINSSCISYGATIPEACDTAILKMFNLTAGGYYILVARMEPENNIQTILEGICMAKTGKKILVIGEMNNSFGKKIMKKYKDNQSILFTGAIYEQVVLNTLRSYCMLYFHGHSVGGTNPSLLEAMACGALICANDNPFNRAILGDDAYYFSSSLDIMQLTETMPGNMMIREMMIQANLQKIRQAHSWHRIADEYENLFIQSYSSGK